MGKKSFSSSVAIYFSLFVTTFFDSISSASPSGSCSPSLSLNTKLMPFDTSSLICNNAWADQDFILLYKESEGVWSFVVSTPNKNAYIAIGFSPDGSMVGSTAVAGWISATGKGMARQYRLDGENPKQCKPDSGDLPLVPNKTLIVMQDSRLYLAFQLKRASPPLSNLIYAVGPQGSLPGSDLLLAEHQYKLSTTVNYTSGESATISTSNTLQTSHGLLALLGWGVLIPVGVVVARYGKQWDPLWFYAHLCIQGLGFGLGVAAIITGFKLEDQAGIEVDNHKAIGIVILVLGTLQVMAVLARPDKASKVRKYWNWYHHYVGRAAIVLAIANIFYGLSLAEEQSSWRIGFGVFLGVWGLVTLVLEVGMRLSKD